VVSINGIERNWNKSKPGDPGNKKASVDLSTQAASVKHLSELRSVHAGGFPQPKEAIYNELGELKHWGTDASKMDTDSESKCVDVSTKKYAALIGYDAGSQRSEYYDNTFQKKPPSIDSQRREELQAIMQDKTLGKVERGKKIDEVKLKYSSQAAAEIDRERNKALQEVVKDRTLKKGERIKRMKELKRVYDEKLLLC
jgi:5-methylthioribose kinase